MKKEITIIGAGLVGSLLSIYLSKRGYKVTIYERRRDMRKEEMIAGRSINLALSDRGIRALEEVGIMEEIRKIAIPMHGRQMHYADGSTPYQAYGKEGQFINSVSRGELNRKLMDLAEENGVQIFFNEKCENINWQTRKITFTTTTKRETDNEKQETRNYDFRNTRKRKLGYGPGKNFNRQRSNHSLVEPQRNCHSTV